MFLYNVISELNAQQVTLVVFATGILYLIYLVLFRKLPTIKVAFIALLSGFVLTLLSMLIVSGAPSGMQFHDKYGWPSQFYIVSRDTTASQEGVDVYSLMIRPTIKIPNLVANLVLYTLISLLFIALIQNGKSKNNKAIIYLCLSLVFSLGLLISIAGINTYHDSFPEDDRTTTNLTSNDNNSKTIVEGKVRILETNIDEIQQSGDIFIESVSYSNGELIISSQFSGCDPHEITLYIDPSRTKSIPPQGTAYLKVDSSSPCEIMNNAKVSFKSILDMADVNLNNSLWLNIVDSTGKGLGVVIENNNIDQSTKDKLNSSLLKAYPELDLNSEDLPPHMLYYFPCEENGWRIVYTTEGSGIDQILAAECFEINRDSSVARLGSYQAKGYDSYIVTDVSQLDESTCKIRDLN